MPTHSELFDSYVEELRKARDEALEWWQDLLDSEATDPDTSTTQVRLRWPAGPVSYPRVLAVYRKYYLECVTLNDRILSDQDGAQPTQAGWGEEDEESDERTIPPRALLTDDLAGADPELHEFMGSLVFSPIGTDDQGNTA